MSYIVQFVGLACFLREDDSRQVLLPDGRMPPEGIEPHFASLSVDPNSVSETSGWNGDAEHPGIFELPPCDIAFEGAEAEDIDLDTSRHDGLLPQLKKIDPNFQIDPDRAETIARVHISSGTLAAYRIPGGTAAISQLEVPHDQSIHVTVTPRDGSSPRHLVLQPNTEIVLSNTGRGGYAGLNGVNNHFRIYEKLSVRPVTLTEPEDAPGLPPSPTSHTFFGRPRAMGLSSGCSNTGCCSP